MEIVRKWRLAVPLAAVLLVGACSDGNAPAAPETNPLFAAAVPENGLGACMGDDALASGITSGMKAANDLNCTSNDIDLAQTIVNSYSFDNKTFTAFTGQAVECVEGQKIYVNMDAVLEQNANSERSDIGIWIAQDGGTAVTGSCLHYNLVNGTKGTVNTDNDQCANMVSGATTQVALGTIEVTCQDATNDGFLDVGSCIGWSQPGGDVACPYNGSAAINFRFGTVPANKSKCNCDPFQIPISVAKQAQLNVRKACVPSGDNGTFDLLIDGNVEANNAACGGQTGLKSVGAGTTSNPGAIHTFAEGDFTLANYNSSWECRLADVTGAPTGSVISQCGAGGNASCSGSGTGPNQVKLNPDQRVACTFTNERKAGIVIRKATTPSTNSQSFGFTSPTLSPVSFNLAHGGSQSFNNIAPGTYRITENTQSGFRLTAIDCQAATGVTYSVSLANRWVDITVASGATGDCTFRNEQLGTIVIRKETVPNGSSQSFAFTHNVGSNSNPTVGSPFNLTDGNGQTISNVVPGTYTVTESLTSGWDLVASGDGHTTACVDPSTNSTITLATRVASINVAAGETVTCTFVNRQRATLTLAKREGGGLPLTRAWEFQLRTGASISAAGTVVATASANLTTGVVSFSGDFAPGSYQLCEINMPVGWTNNIDGFVPNGSSAEGDNSAECVNITLVSGANGPGGITNVPNPIDNTPPPRGDARTIGYWKNWSSCTKGNQYTKAIERGDNDRVLDFYLTPGSAIYPFGDITSLTCEQAVNLLSKSSLDGTKRASDAAYNMAAQLLAAKLNKAAGAQLFFCINNVITAAQNLLANNPINFLGTGAYLPTGTTLTALRTQANTYAGLLDAYNNNELTAAQCTAAGF